MEINSIMKIKFRHTRVFTFLLTLLLLGNVANSYADVTYHILTLPISTTKETGKLYDWNFNATTYSGGNYRYEALVCTSTSTTVGLPEAFKSPLLQDAAYHYYSATKVTKTSHAKVYANNETKLDLYQVNGEADLTAGTSDATDGTHIYVTYTYTPSYVPTKLGFALDLSGDTKYSIQLSKDRFLAYNRDRGNRITAPLDSKVSNGDGVYDRSQYFTRTKTKMFEDHIVKLTSDDGVSIAGNLYFLFKLQGGDPYHIIIQNGYTQAHDNWTYTQNNLMKNPNDGILYGNINNNMWLQNEDHLTYKSKTEISTDNTPGRFKDNAENQQVKPVVSAFALINHPNLSKPSNWESFEHDGGEYAFVASKMNYNGLSNQPSSDGRYFYLQPNGGTNPQIKLNDKNTKLQDNAILVKIGAIEHFVFKVKTPFGNYVTANLDMSTIFGDDDPMTCIPETLKRKYVTFKGCYSDENLTSAVSNFYTAAINCTTTEVIDGVTRKVIYLKYETDMPFETCLKASPTYDDLTWYNFYTNKEIQYIAWAEKKNDSGTAIDNYNFHTNKNHSRYSYDSHFAFVGDPFEMKIVTRKASDEAGSLKYVTINETINDNGNYIEGDGTAWEIIYDDNTGNYADCFRLNKFNDTSTAFGWHYGTGSFALYGGAASDQAARITVLEVPTKSYVYHIMRGDDGHTIAAKATVTQEAGVRLDFAHIPEIIRSPFINPALGVTLSFYGTSDNAANSSSPITYAPDNGTDATQEIWVRYDLSGMNDTYKKYIDGTQAFNVRLNGEYIYHDNGSIKSTSDVADNNNYRWKLGGSDPYAMTIQNVGNTDKYVAVEDWNNGTLSWADAAPASKYIIKGTSNLGVYEVMAATGDGVDASETYYNIGRPDANTVKIYSNSTYQHGYSQLRFQLTPLTAHNVTYHLIDKANYDLIQVTVRHADTDDAYFPDDYRSPLVATYHYFSDASCSLSIDKVGDHTDIYVTYDTGTDYDLQNKKIMYLLKYEMGDTFKQEDGSDGLSSTAQKAVYPYCNGDCNFFVYGQEQYDIQQQSAASTRTRWAWFLESANNDPYHVKICSRQTELYNGDEARAYFRTYMETYHTDDTKHVVTTLTWPGVSGIAGTEYMVLGSIGQFRLLTTNAVDDGDGNISNDMRQTVNSFEQYWKTWDTVRKKVLGDGSAVASQTDPNTVPETPATTIASDAGKNNRTYLTDEMGWHSYEQWAYAKRWNGYNISGATSKGWEIIEHWYQTVEMGEGYFDLVPVTIDPALILLDQHGWEIMRKALPSSEDDPKKESKYDALRVYDSPMVKEYHFWTKTSKRTGFHQYYNLSQKVTVDGEPYSSTSLTDLPPIDATNVKDAKGNIYDQYVTYVVKDEYVKSLGKPFLIQQGSNYASTSDGATITKNDVPSPGGMSQYIIENAANLSASGNKNVDLWYLNPNEDIDIEMGYGGYAHDWTNDYTVTDFSASGFDPYNIQISSVAYNTSYFVTDATTVTIDEGALFGNGSTNALGTQKSIDYALVGGMDNRTLRLTNATFMAVQDESGNMQLMPRFDHEKRMKDFSTLVSASDAEIEKTYTTLYRPIVYDYRIIDNSGNESIRYRSGGDLVPQTPEWFKSQLAKDFKYYSAISGSTGSGEITESLEGASLTDNTVYVRYSYDEDADFSNILKGKWLTMTLNEKCAQYTTVSETVGIYGGTKPETVDSDDKTWQWKLLATPQSDPDPYAVSLYNRNTSEGTATEVNGKTKFALLSWYDESGIDSNSYTLAVAGLGTEANYDYTYQYLNGASMTNDNAATTAAESGVKGTSCSYTAGAKVEFSSDVQHAYTYKIYTNNGTFAVSATQTQDEAEENSFVPTLPEEIKSPLLNSDQFLYYGAEADMGNSDKELSNLFGLYEDDVYVRYTAYDKLKTEYKVPNVRNATGGTVARDESSNDAALDINDELLYNIIWYDDNMMQSTDNSAISGLANQALQGGDAYVWQFEGNDPYAIKIKHKSSGKYAVGTASLAGSATSTFMLLPSSDGWQYGVLQETGTTGDAAKRLTTVGDALTADASTEPTKFIIFGLSTYKVIYHLVIANIGNSETIPYYENAALGSKAISGSTKRDLATTYQLGSTISINGNSVNYCVDGGHVTLGDLLAVPAALKKPNCKYFFYVGGIYDNEACTETTNSTSLNGTYKGRQITQMGTEPGLIGKTIVINIVYAFDDGLPTNNGANFVTTTGGTQWYTVETSDETPYLARFTYGGTGVSAMEGRDPHYTNEFLWKPVGDPYGFMMYNRYVYKNVNLTNHVMTTTAAPANGLLLTLESNTDASHPEYAANAIYELYAGDTDGYFFMRPMLNTGVAIYNNNGTMTLSSENATEWAFGLSEAQFKPYYDRAGYVGGLNTTGKTAYDNANGNLQTIQGIVYNDANIVSFANGYYRLHNLPNTDDITTPRYMSGYTHKTELTNTIPMHFYEKKGVNTTFAVLGSGFTSTAATRGDISITGPEYDPASIFYITGSKDAAKMQTQGLYVKENKMTETEGSATSFHITDIGGATVVIDDGSSTPRDKKYLYYNGTNIYDIGYDNYTSVGTNLAEKSKWCLEPANNTGLYIETHSGGEEATLTDLWYYSSLCVPFDLMISNKDDDPTHSSNAYTCVSDESPWNVNGLHPKSIGKYTNKDGAGYPESLCKRTDKETNTTVNNDYFVPAGTPVLFSTKRATSYIKATIPTTTPSTSISTIFSAKYLEQQLPDWDNTKHVYVFGPAMEGTIELDESDGTISATLPSLGNTNVGFHLNANPNKEAGLSRAEWTRNNYYVLHNKIYYREGSSGAGTRGVQFVPVLFGDEESEGSPTDILNALNDNMVGDGCIYDLQGRKVATEQQVQDGSWRQWLSPGIYILNGKKFSKRR